MLYYTYNPTITNVLGETLVETKAWLKKKTQKLFAGWKQRKHNIISARIGFQFELNGTKEQFYVPIVPLQGEDVGAVTAVCTVKIDKQIRKSLVFLKAMFVNCHSFKTFFRPNSRLYSFNFFQIMIFANLYHLVHRDPDDFYIVGYDKKPPHSGPRF